MVIVVANGYPVMDEDTTGVLYWSTEAQAQGWINNRPAATVRQRKQKDNLYVMTLKKARV